MTFQFKKAQVILLFSPQTTDIKLNVTLRGAAIFWSIQFHSVTITGQSASVVSHLWRLSKEDKPFTVMALVCVFGRSPAIRGAQSLVFLLFLKPSGDWVSAAPLNYQGSLQVQGQSELWVRSGSAPSLLHPAPSVVTPTVIAVNYLCNVCYLGGSVSVFALPGLFHTIFFFAYAIPSAVL